MCKGVRLACFKPLFSMYVISLLACCRHYCGEGSESNTRPFVHFLTVLEGYRKTCRKLVWGGGLFPLQFRKVTGRTSRSVSLGRCAKRRALIVSHESGISLSVGTCWVCPTLRPTDAPELSRPWRNLSLLGSVQLSGRPPGTVGLLHADSNKLPLA